MSMENNYREALELMEQHDYFGAVRKFRSCCTIDRSMIRRCIESLPKRYTALIGEEVYNIDQWGILQRADKRYEELGAVREVVSDRSKLLVLKEDGSLHIKDKKGWNKVDCSVTPCRLACTNDAVGVIADGELYWIIEDECGYAVEQSASYHAVAEVVGIDGWTAILDCGGRVRVSGSVPFEESSSHDEWDDIVDIFQVDGNLCAVTADGRVVWAFDKKTFDLDKKWAEEELSHVVLVSYCCFDPVWFRDDYTYYHDGDFEYELKEINEHRIIYAYDRDNGLSHTWVCVTADGRLFDVQAVPYGLNAMDTEYTERSEYLPSKRWERDVCNEPVEKYKELSRKAVSRRNLSDNGMSLMKILLMPLWLIVAMVAWFVDTLVTLRWKSVFILLPIICGVLLAIWLLPEIREFFGNSSLGSV